MLPLEAIKKNGAIMAIDEQIRANLYAIKKATEEAAKSGEKKTFLFLKREMAKIDTIRKEIDTLYAELEVLRG